MSRDLVHILGWQIGIPRSLAEKLVPFIERLLAQEREKVREMCTKYLEKETKQCADYAEDTTGEARAAWNRTERLYENCADEIRQLDLTKLESGLAASSREKGGDAK